MQNDEIGNIFQPSTLETIDAAVMGYIEELNLHVNTNRGFLPVPIIWVGAERTYQIKHDLTLRDKEGLLKLPLMTVERKDIIKDPTKSPIPANIPDLRDGGLIPIRRRINQEKTSIFKRAQNIKKAGVNADVGGSQSNHPSKAKAINEMQISPMFDTRPISLRDKVVYETTYIPIPVYITVKYEIHIRTEYQQQMNTLLSPFIAAHSGIGRNHRYFILRKDNHLYEGFIDGNFSNDNNAAKLDEEERMFNTVINFEILGYLIGGDANETKNVAKTYENIVEVKMSRERVIVGDEVERQNLSGSDPFFKE